MSNEMEELPPWQPIRWSVATLLLLLLHLGGIYLLSGWAKAETVRKAPDFQVRLLTDPNACQAMLDRYSLRDPTRFAVVSPRGFSGPAWLTVEPPPFQLPEWSDPQRWLTQDTTALGDNFRSYVKANLGSTLSIAPRSPALAKTALTPPRASSRLFVEGLPTRRLLTVPNPPVWPSGFVLQATEIEILIDARGRVFSPRLTVPPIREVGVAQVERQDAQRAADRHALSLIPQIRFQPNPQLGEDRFDKGRVIVQWITRPSTNATELP
jgi:hypothetical protein